MRYLGVADIQNIAEAIEYRRNMFTEDLSMSVGVVLLNYGEREVKVECIRGEWSGVKGDLQPGLGIPTCPGGHPLIETTLAPRLALVDQ